MKYFTKRNIRTVIDALRIFPEAIDLKVVLKSMKFKDKEISKILKNE